MINNIKTFTLFVLLLISCSHNYNIVGEYCRCPFHCECISIFPDSTFEYMLSGDLFGHNVIKGYWEPLTNNIIRANSYTQPPKKGNYRPIKFYDANINEGLELHIVCDSTGESLPGVNILEFAVSDSSGELGTVTDSNGIAYLNQPGLLRIKLQYIGFYDRTFDLKEIKNSGIEISMIEDINFNDIFITNEIWEIKGNKLFFINDNYLDEEPLELRKKHPNSRINVN